MAAANKPQEAPPSYDQSVYQAGYDQPREMFGKNDYLVPAPQPHQIPAFQPMPPPTTNVQVTQVTAGPAIIVAPYRPADQTCLAIAVCLFCSPIPGMFAIFFAIQASSEFDVGNYQEGQRYHNYARYSMLASVLLAVVVWVVFIVLIAV